MADGQPQAAATSSLVLEPSRRTRTSAASGSSVTLRCWGDVTLGPSVAWRRASALARGCRDRGISRERDVIVRSPGSSAMPAGSARCRPGSPARTNRLCRSVLSRRTSHTRAARYRPHGLAASNTFAADLEHPSPHGLGYPREDPVGEDVVERSPAPVHVAQVAGHEGDVLEAQVRHAPQTCLDLPDGEVDADEGGRGQAVRHADEVVSARAAQLEDPRGRDGRRLEPAEPSRQGDPVRVREAVDEPLVGEGLVALPRRVGVLHSGPFSPAGPAPGHRFFSEFDSRSPLCCVAEFG